MQPPFLPRTQIWHPSPNWGTDRPADNFQLMLKTWQIPQDAASEDCRDPSCPQHCLTPMCAGARKLPRVVQRALAVLTDEEALQSVHPHAFAMPNLSQLSATLAFNC